MDFNMRGDWFQHPDDVPAQHMYRELLREDNAVIYVAEVNGRFSGFAVAFAQYKFPTAQRRKQILINVDQIVVAASARRRGVGHALMKQVRTLAVLASADRITSSM
jgi:GNAT superfamily N-acetyltransferase